MKNKMIDAFKYAQGGLFSKVEKADVGGSYQEMERKGIRLMGWADPFMPDYSLPAHVKKALMTEIDQAAAPHYTAPIGNQELKNEIAKKLKEKNHLKVDPCRNILITPGSDSGLYFAILPFIDQGDEVLIPSPSYPNNFLNISIMKGKPISVPLSKEEHYQLNEEILEKYCTPRTKMILLTHPNNPTTTVFNKKSLEILRNFVIKHDLILVCDQAFEDFCYENEFITPASLEGMFERTITVFSFSKGMGLSGLRVGYLVCSDIIMDSMFANAVSVLGATNTMCQRAIIPALKDSSFMNEFKEAFDYRRHQVFKIINSIPNVSMDLPESGFLGWIDVSKIGNSSEIVSYLIREAKVSVNDGINYGIGGEGHLRIVLGVYKDNDKVINALYSIKDALIKWQNLSKKDQVIDIKI
ncbi:pyridoxal phosphate-dependent aminotransferase [Traorella massiliensis]|uniref:pyridoxal phosphate-dependent aminotransferase n=1 Tax=Traorella massiliensis TaxID=1903263 RepID=UPI0008F7F2D6|nr:pyridoxal phosphate-dependent aminotransferase [Traorella massiliensis]